MFSLGMNVNCRDAHGETPLIKGDIFNEISIKYAAVKAGNVYSIKWLLNHEADPYTMNK